jgi:hypothetical protein
MHVQTEVAHERDRARQDLGNPAASSGRAHVLHAGAAQEACEPPDLADLIGAHHRLETGHVISGFVETARNRIPVTVYEA